MKSHSRQPQKVLDMARKTTKLMKKLIEQHESSMRHFTSVIAAKERGDETALFREQGVEYYEGLALGQSTMLEFALMEANCYHGFTYVDSLKRPIGPDDKDFAEWRRIYFIKN